MSQVLRALLLATPCIFYAACGGDSGDSSSTEDDGGNQTTPELLANSTVSVAEDVDTVDVYFTLSVASSVTASIDYELQDDTAVAGQDYTAASGSISFAAGVTQATVSIDILDDADEEPDERFYLRLSNPDGLVTSLDEVSITILASDTLSPLAEFDPHWGIIGAFTEAQTCASCHSAASDDSGVLRYPKQADGDDISPFSGWKHSAMAHSFDDPYFQAKMSAEADEFDDIAGTVEDKCLSCHSPMAHNHAHTTLTSLSDDDCPLDADGCFRAETAMQQDIAREGVGCTLCHQIDPTNLGSEFSGAYIINDSKIIYGPYTDPITQPMAVQTQYSIMGSDHIQSSALCAVCHNLKTPTVDVNNGQLTGTEFVEQAPYSEWLNSTYNEGDSGDKSCQDCHMPIIDGYATQIATRINGTANLSWPLRTEYSQHGFRGANNYLLTLLKTFRNELGIANSTTVAGFDQQIDNNLAFLQSQAAEITIDSVQLQNDTLAVNVTVSNKTGHKLPTSFPSRRMWLNLIIRNATGAVLFASGTPDQNGHLNIDDQLTEEVCLEDDKPGGFVASYCYHPHQNTITSAEQIAVYEAVMADVEAQVTYTLLYGDQYLKDNRIPPEGFTTSGINYSDEVAVVGLAASDGNFNNDGSGEGSGTDTITYALPWSGLDTTGLTVEANLYYQTIRPAFADSLHGDSEAIERFEWMYEQIKPQAELLDQHILNL